MARPLHKGVQEFSPAELSGVALGQNGFKVLNNQTITCGPGGDTGFTEIKYFVALKIIDADGEVEARTVTPGDDLTLASASSGVRTADFSSSVTLVNGDIVYGAFDKVEAAGANTWVIAYIGR
tara:strand:+ start:730 stop:1098 length:369 start_codon:yes stop_codon:yes gene_type:complete